MKGKDGGPAFPRYRALIVGEPELDGMSLLDYFAGQAVMGQLASTGEGGIWHDGKLAAWSYDLAEAMLAERERRMKEEK